MSACHLHRTDTFSPFILQHNLSKSVLSLGKEIEDWSNFFVAIELCEHVVNVRLTFLVFLSAQIVWKCPLQSNIFGGFIFSKVSQWQDVTIFLLPVWMFIAIHFNFLIYEINVPYIFRELIFTIQLFQRELFYSFLEAILVIIRLNSRYCFPIVDFR